MAFKTTLEILQALVSGHKICGGSWPTGAFLIATNTGIRDEQGKGMSFAFNVPEDWEFYSEPVPATTKLQTFYRRAWVYCQNDKTVIVSRAYEESIEKFDRNWPGHIRSPEIVTIIIEAPV